MDNVLRKVAGKLQLSDNVVGLAQVASQVQLLEVALPAKDAVNLDGEYLIPLFLATEVLGAFRGIVNDLGDLVGETRLVSNAPEFCVL